MSNPFDWSRTSPVQHERYRAIMWDAGLRRFNNKPLEKLSPAEAHAAFGWFVTNVLGPEIEKRREAEAKQSRLPGM